MKLKQTTASAHLVQYRFKIREGTPEAIIMDERICERDQQFYVWSEMLRSDRWWERRCMVNVMIIGDRALEQAAAGSDVITINIIIFINFQIYTIRYDTIR